MCLATKYGRRDFFPEDCNILDFLSTLFQLIFSQLRKTPTVSLQLLHTASAAHCAQNNTKKWRFSRATICMVFLLWDMIFTKVITWAEKISTLYTQLLFIRDAMSARLRSTVQRSDSVNRARSNQQKHQLKKSSKEVQDIAILRKKVPAAILAHLRLRGSDLAPHPSP